MIPRSLVRHVAAPAISLLLTAAAAQAAAQITTDPVELAERRADDGAPLEALDILSAAADSLYFLSASDPRIGIAHIRIATEHAIASAYGEASRLYLQGFTDADMDRYGEVVEEEVRRIQPLLQPADSARWDSLAVARDPEILVEIRRFWVLRDPTPQTAENERLVEHWGRIAFARRRFTQAVNSPYRTDDRGTIFVKYGAPGRRKAGNLGSDGTELRRWVRDRIAQESIARLDPNPGYEVWVYDTLNPRELIYFLFGNEDGTGPYRLVDGVDDLISSAAKNPNSRRVTPGNLRASHYLELFYYAELSAVGGDFSRRYSTLEQLWGQAESRSITLGTGGVPTEGQVESVSIQWRQDDQQKAQDPFRRPERVAVSDLEDVATVQLVAERTRILSPENEPLMVFTALSAPRQRLTDRDSLEALDLDVRGVRHTLIVRDSVLREVGQLAGTSVRFGDDAVSTFTLRHTREPLFFTMVASEEESASRPAGEISLFPGHMHMQPVPPLRTDPDSLEVSDLVIGIQPHPGLDASRLAFPVVPGQVLWRTDPILAYVEVYHLRMVGGLARFRANFTVRAWDPILGRAYAGAEPTTISFDLESEEPTSRHVLSLGIENLIPGHYRVSLTVEDLQAGTARTRATFVEIGSLSQRGR